MPAPSLLPILKAGVTYGPAIAQGLKTAGSLVDVFRQDPGEGFKQQIMDSGILRHAQGQFTGAERNMLLRNAQPQLNQAFHTVGAAGLANTGAGADVIANQQQNVFHRAQDRAFQMVNTPGFLENRYEFARGTSRNVLSDIGTIATGAFEQYNRYKQRGERNAEFDNAIQGIGEAAKELKELKDLYEKTLGGGDGSS